MDHRCQILLLLVNEEVLKETDYLLLELIDFAFWAMILACNHEAISFLGIHPS